MRNWSDAERAAERARMKGGQVLSGWSGRIVARDAHSERLAKTVPQLFGSCASGKSFWREGVHRKLSPSYCALYLPNKGSGGQCLVASSVLPIYSAITMVPFHCVAFS